MGHRIRQAVKADIPGIQSLISNNLDKLLPRETEEIDNYIDSFMVAEDNGEIVGCCCLEVYSKKIAEIRSVAVRRDRRQRGVGSALVGEAIGRGKALGIMEIMVVTSNVDFFEKLKFNACLDEKYALFWTGK